MSLPPLLCPLILIFLPGQFSEGLWSPNWYSYLLKQARVPNLILITFVVSNFCLNGSVFFAEVARTRLREEGSGHRKFWPCLMAVYRTEGRLGLYRGFCVQLLRQIPNSAILMTTYELACHYLTLWLKNSAAYWDNPIARKLLFDQELIFLLILHWYQSNTFRFFCQCCAFRDFKKLPTCAVSSGYFVHLLLKGKYPLMTSLSSFLSLAQ